MNRATATSSALVMSRAWAMPSPDTFSIAPIRDLLDRWLEGCEVIVDPFARNSTIGTIRNDLNPETAATYHMPAEQFAEQLLDEGLRADAVLFDPPYSPGQIIEVYQQVGLSTTTAGRNAELYSKVREPLRHILRPGGIAISCGWNSGGFGKGRGLKLREVLIVCHGGAHNDTIVTVEEKLPHLFDQGAA